MKKTFLNTSLSLLLTLIIQHAAFAQDFKSLDDSPHDIVYFRTNKISPPTIKVLYGRPQKNGRDIFDEVIPYGEIWRVGANEATEVVFYKDVVFGETKVKAGTYVLYAIPNEKEWTLILSSRTDVWGTYEYELNSRDWIAVTDGSGLSLAAKILSFGFWLGHLDSCKFVSDSGTDRGTTLLFTEITTDATDGAVRYSLQHTVTGDDAGAFVTYWNITEYATATLAWASDELYLLHGIGIGGSATNNIGALLVGLLTLSLPDVPVLVNLFLAVPIWACIVYVLWYVIKEMIPFV